MSAAAPHALSPWEDAGGTGIAKTWAVAVCLGALGVAFLPSISDLVVHTWLTFGAFYGHGLMVVGLTADLVWHHRRRIFASREDGSTVLAILACGAAAGWMLAWTASIDSVQITLALTAIVLACCAVLGRRSLVSFGLPFGLIYLAAPIWHPAAVLLQNLATLIVARLLLITHVPAHIEGNLIQIPAGTIEVESGCSGLGFLLVSCTLAGYLALRYRPRLATVSVTVAVAALLGVAANWLRIFAIVLIAHYGGLDQPIVHKHIWFGWVIYTVLMLPALWTAIRHLESPGSYRQEPLGTAGGVRRGFLLALLVGTAAPPILARGLDHLAGSGAPAFAGFPADIETPGPEGPRVMWTRIEVADPEVVWQPDFPNADETHSATFRSDTGSEVIAFTARYDRQTRGREVVGGMNDLGGSGWRGRQRRVRSLVIGGARLTVSERRFENSAGESLCVWYWYRIGTRHAGTDMQAKLAEIGQKFLGRGDASIIAVGIPGAEASCTAARPSLTAFAKYWLR